MAPHPSTPAVGGPAEPVPVAVLARTSTLALQDPAASLRRQITSTREWLPPGFYVAGYFWDVESGGLDLEDRGHGHYEQFTAQGIPRDGGLADLLEEARSASPRFAAVVVEDIERASRDFYNSVKLERELSDQGIPLFATDEPADIKGVNPTTLLIRRVKQGFAEYFRLQLKEKVWKGLREHSEQGWNIGKVPYGYLPEKVTHPNPSKAAAGMSKTRLALDPDRAPIVEQIYAWRTVDKLAVNTIVKRLNADLVAYPPADGAWTLGGVAAMLRNPKYTGYQVFGRTQHGTPVPPGQWHWSPAPTHPAIIDRATWDKAQQVGAEHATSWGDTLVPHPTAKRSYLLRSRMRCKICQRRMVGRTKIHPGRDPKGDYTYFICTHDRANPRHVAKAPDHPATVSARHDLVLGELRTGLESYAFTPGRKERLRELLPAGASEQQARTDAQAAAIKARLKQLATAQDSLVHDLATLPTDPAAVALRARIHAHFTELHHEHEEKEAQLKALTRRAPAGADIDLIDLLPILTSRFHELPQPIQAELFTALDIQVLWNTPQHQATFSATITDTIPGVIDALLARGSNDPATTMPSKPGKALTSNNPGARFTRPPILRETVPSLPGGAPCWCGRWPVSQSAGPSQGDVLTGGQPVVRPDADQQRLAAEHLGDHAVLLGYQRAGDGHVDVPGGQGGGPKCSSLATAANASSWRNSTGRQYR
jgi:DNA invertase Pin-like site-specific DNA recombinase